MPWPRLPLALADGIHPAVAPAIISASRATDIPALHSAWLLQRLRAGYCRWRNPFNARQTQVISFARCGLLVFWSKNSLPLLPHLDEIRVWAAIFIFSSRSMTMKKRDWNPACRRCKRG